MSPRGIHASARIGRIAGTAIIATGTRPPDTPAASARRINDHQHHGLIKSEVYIAIKLYLDIIHKLWKNYYPSFNKMCVWFKRI
jgi:hypothetical protein